MSELLFFFCRNACYRNARSRYILDHYSSGPNLDIVGDRYSSKDLGELADIYIVPDDRGVVRIASFAADAAVSMDSAVFADPGFRIYYHRAEMLQLKAFSEAAGTYYESESGSKSVFLCLIVICQETARFVKRIPFFFP